MIKIGILILQISLIVFIVTAAQNGINLTESPDYQVEQEGVNRYGICSAPHKAAHIR